MPRCTCKLPSLSSVINPVTPLYRHDILDASLPLHQQPHAPGSAEVTPVLPGPHTGVHCGFPLNEGTGATLALPPHLHVRPRSYTVGVQRPIPHTPLRSYRRVCLGKRCAGAHFLIQAVGASSTPQSSFDRSRPGSAMHAPWWPTLCTAPYNLYRAIPAGKICCNSTRSLHNACIEVRPLNAEKPPP